PRINWEPGAAIFYTDNEADGTGRLTMHPSVNFFNVIDSQNLTLDVNKTYEIVLRVEQVGLYDRQYSYKIWEAGGPEPTSWNLQAVETFSLNDAPATGSLYLNAHYFDVQFNDVTVTEIEGRDIIQGTDGNDILSAVTPGDTTPGVGELDVLSGYAGADRFDFGDSTQSFYDDGVAGTDGIADYAFVWDFTVGEDTVLLHGSESDYALLVDDSRLTAGTSIWRIEQGGADELVGLLNGVSGLSLSDDSFLFTDDLLV
ncbi:MAG: hypothetical protein AAF677_00005, partial [Pseudomonadota bacterium]